MKRYKFRLEKILEYRQALKEEALLVLARSNQVVADLEEQKNQKLAALVSDSGQAGTQDANTNQSKFFELSSLYRNRLRAELEVINTNLEQAKIEQEKALIAYQEACRNKEALEKLKKKGAAIHDQLVNQEEAKFLDELATMRSAIKI